MAEIKVENNTYKVDPLTQWDLNQELVIYGLSLSSIPEIHFTNAAMEKAIVRQATMDDAGVIRCNIPNSLLQKPYKIKAYVCIYEGDTFKTLYLITIPVKARKMPADYTLTVADEEVYSFNALENKIDNILADTVVELNEIINDVQTKLDNGDFVGETGPQGEQGQQGEQGLAGSGSLEVIVAEVTTGSFPSVSFAVPTDYADGLHHVVLIPTSDIVFDGSTVWYGPIGCLLLYYNDGAWVGTGHPNLVGTIKAGQGLFVELNYDAETYSFTYAHLLNPPIVDA